MTDYSTAPIVDLKSEDISSNNSNSIKESGKDRVTLPNDDSELVLTWLMLTPWDGPESKEVIVMWALTKHFRGRKIGIVTSRQLYRFTTQHNYIEDENVIAIELLQLQDMRFGFLNGGNQEEWKGGNAPYFIHRDCKTTWQCKLNFILNFIPLMRLGWHNAKDWIMKYSVGKWKGTHMIWLHLTQLKVHTNSVSKMIVSWPVKRLMKHEKTVTCDTEH